LTRREVSRSASVREALEARLQGLPGIARRPSRHGDSQSYFVGEREIAHFHGDERMDVRLTKERIRELKEQGAFDERVATRGPSAEWVTVQVVAMSDLASAVRWVEEALRANA
jgi:Family of unknown function (DUF5519)